jgi:hypothetical protein
MSIEVELTELQAAAGTQAPYAYLLTVSASLRTHVVAVAPVFAPGEIVCRTGASSVRNASERPQVTLVWPPLDMGGYSLLVDADARVDGSTVRLQPTHAVLHRPAPAPDPSSACAHDCRPVTLGGQHADRRADGDAGPVGP